MKTDFEAFCLICIAFLTRVDCFIRSPHASSVHRSTWLMSGSDNRRFLSQQTDIASESHPTAVSESSPSVNVSNEFPKEKYELPWSDIQEWALRDNLAKFIIQVPIEDNGRSEMRVYVLWRNFCNDVIELAGYPIPFLVERQNEMASSNATAVRRLSDEVLPYLDEFEFDASGGVTGKVYGVRGVADGTRITTTPVGDVQTTVPKRFIRTNDGSAIYELGRPISDVYSFDGRTSKIALASRSVETISQSVSGDSNVGPLDPDIVNLGALTALVIGGALAVETLSHHLTINVFWV